MRPSPHRVREFREEAGLTQEELARRAEITVSVFRRIETSRGGPSLPTAQAIARVLGKSVDEVFPPLEVAS